jgi:hypothetical protein
VKGAGYVEEDTYHGVRIKVAKMKIIISCGYSREDWSNLSCAERNRIYMVRNQLENVQTIVVMLKDQNESQNDDVSFITSTLHNQRTQDNNTISRVSVEHESRQCQDIKWWEHLKESMSKKKSKLN